MRFLKFSVRTVFGVRVRIFGMLDRPISVPPFASCHDIICVCCCYDFALYSQLKIKTDFRINSSLRGTMNGIPAFVSFSVATNHTSTSQLFISSSHQPKLKPHNSQKLSPSFHLPFSLSLLFLRCA